MTTEAMQTGTPLPRMSMSNSNRPIDVILWWASPEHGLDMDQPYQRGVVWGPTRQANLIRSLLMGIPIPSLVLNDRFRAGFKHPGWDEARCLSHAVIDGKQRITAILRFFNGDLTVPATWFPVDRIAQMTGTQADPQVTYPGLTVPGQRFFRNTTLAVAEGTLRTLDGETEVFDLINFGGLAQGDTDDDIPEEG